MEIDGLKDKIKQDNKFIMHVKGKEQQIKGQHALSERQVEIMLQGGIINWVKTCQQFARNGGDLMVDREQTCKACDGTGMQADDEGWQYKCSVCHGTGYVDQKKHVAGEASVMTTDENNRLLD